MIQLALAFFGLSALALAYTENSRLRRLSPYLGLCAQPAWFATTIQAHQWGIFALSLVYTALYLGKIYSQWRSA